MKRKQKVYFDHKAGVAKVAHSRRARGSGPPTLEWDANSHLSWDEFVALWEGRFPTEGSAVSSLSD